MTDKKLIIEKSAKLFKTLGIRGNTMDDIAREMGISKKTLYQHFTDKEQLVAQVIETEKQQIQNKLTDIQLNSENEIEALMRINVLIVNFLKAINPAAVNDLRKHFKLIYDKSRMDYQQLFSDCIRQNIKSGKAKGLYRSDINEELIAQLHTERIDKMKETDNLWGPNAATSEMIKEMTTYYMRGLITENGETILNKHIKAFNKYLKE